MSGHRIVGPGGIVIGGAMRVPSGPLRDQTFQDIYANQLRMSILPSDLSIVFSVTSDRGPGVFTLDDKAIIRMAPITAKILFLEMKVAIEAYEKSLGEIQIPPKISEQINAHAENLSKGLADFMSTPDGEGHP
jgi:hypothetical protein